MNTNRYNKITLRILLCIFFIFVIADHAFAHKVSIFAWVEGDTVYTESKFMGGKTVRNAPIEILDAQGKKLLEGTTNDNGEFSFKIPQKTEMKIVLLAGMGHKAYWTIPVEDFQEDMTASSKKNSINTDIPSEKSIISKPVPEQKQVPPNGLTSVEIQTIIENALDKKMQPFMTRMNKLLNPDHGPDLKDIFGGIGYILGLMGLGAYVHYRNKMKAYEKQ
ncbi:MAG: hypothetical protein HQK75_12725 [Candidatus Magnetomorum sp.]|nr:hypothetical protein [Candidatus Magnetomorum sp.]